MSRRGCGCRASLCGGSGLWLVRRIGVRVEAGHAGARCRSRVPSRARFFASMPVGEHARIDDVRQPPFECPQRFHRGLPASFSGVVIGAPGGAIAELDHGHDVQHPVDLAVAGAGEPMALLLTRGRVQGRGGCSRTRTDRDSRIGGCRRCRPKALLPRKVRCRGVPSTSSRGRSPVAATPCPRL
jgi:hypothetical protein